MKHLVLILGLTAGSLALPACTTTESSAPTSPGVSPAPVEAEGVPVSSFKETAKADKASAIPYPFTTCAVIRKDLEGSPKYRRIYKNHEVLFCCTPCLRAFDANPEAYIGRIVEGAAAKARGEAVNSGW